MTKTNYKPAVQVGGSHGFATNAQVFATREEARASAEDLMDRWFAVVAVDVKKTTDPVNYKRENGRDVPLK